MGVYVDMSNVELGGDPVLMAGFNELSNPITAPNTLPEIEVAVNTPSGIKGLAPQGDELDSAREAMWLKLS